MTLAGSSLLSGGLDHCQGVAAQTSRGYPDLKIRGIGIHSLATRAHTYSSCKERIREEGERGSRHTMDNPWNENRRHRGYGIPDSVGSGWLIIGDHGPSAPP